MSVGFTTQGFQDLLAFPFRTPGARSKLLIACLLGFGGFIVPIVPSLFLIGYGGLIMRRMIVEKGEPYMPEWDNWNEMLMLGLRIGGATLIYSLPMLVLMLVSYFGMMVPALMASFTDPHNTQELGRWVGLQMLGVFGGMCGFGIAMLLAALLWLVLPPVLGHVVAKNSFRAAFQVREWWRVFRANWGGFIVSMILLGGVYMGLVLVAQALYMTVVLCFLLPFVFAVIGAYLSIIAYVVFAQAYVEAVSKLESQPPGLLAPASAPPVA